MFTVNPSALIYTKIIDDKRKFVIEIHAGKPPLILEEAVVARAILGLPAIFSKENALRFWKQEGMSSNTAAYLWRVLSKEGVLIAATAIETGTRFHTWNKYGWGEAYKYQSATEDYPFLQMDTETGSRADTKRMKEYHAKTPAPSSYLELKHTQSFLLEKLYAKDSAQTQFKKLSQSERKGYKGISILFDLCFGRRGTTEFKNQGVFINKATPSGGARHPTEVFLVIFKHADFPSGVYHYNVDSNSLDLLKPGNFYSQSKNATYDLFQKYNREPFAMLVFTSLYERAMWRYRDARSWRAVLIDLGHALMLFRRVSTSLGIRSYTYQKFKDASVAKIIGVDPVKQTPFYVASLISK